jgi:O-antigen/teichoic acid export membrane protein
MRATALTRHKGLQRLLDVAANLPRQAQYLWGAHGVMLANSATLAVSAGITAALGFLYWWVAARYFEPRSVGLAAAAISMMNLVALAGEFGLGPLLIGESQRRPKDSPHLIAAALIAALFSSGLLGLLYVVLVNLSPNVFGRSLDTGISDVLFIAGCSLAGFALVLDNAYAGLLRSSLHLYRNGLFSASKLIILVAIALAMSVQEQAEMIFLAWTLGLLLSIAVLVAHRGHRIWYTPNFGLLWFLAPTVLRHHLLNVATLAPGLILPLLVTVALSAEDNAVFYASWMVLSVILLVPASLTTILFTVGAAEPQAIADRMKCSFLICALTSVVAAIGLYFCSGLILSFFGPVYASQGEAILQVLGLSVFAVTVKAHYVAIQRINDRLLSAFIVVGAGAILEMILSVAGGRMGGLLGFAQGWVIAVYLEALVVTPVLLRAADIGWLRVRRYGGVSR